MADRRNDPDEPSTYRQTIREVGPYLGLGLQLGATMAVFAGGGYAVDQWLGSEPWGVLVGAGLGMAALIAQLVQVTNELNRQTRERRGDRRSRDANVDEE